ncbi:MAG: MATE family efflux transporter [Anaerotruncus sp.]|nr:MATE family efflux transporter [Anaerotruncus sp.]
MKQIIQLSDHFTYQKLLRFTLPSVVMMIFSSIYGVVDGFFISNYAGKTPFAAACLIYPYMMVFSTCGFMIGTGGTALISKTMGEGDCEKANRLFSMLVYLSIAGGIVLSVIAIVLLRPVAILLGARGAIIDDCVVYGTIILPALFSFILQNEFQSFCVAAEKPQLGLWLTVAAGLTNILLDALFVAVFRWGLAGAAIATALSQLVGGLVPLVYFLRPNKSRLRLCKPSFDGRALLKVCTNGSSELMSTMSTSLLSMLHNFQLLRFAGEDGVAAYGIIMYVDFIFIAVFLGYAIGSAPIIGYHFGAGNHPELKSLFRQSNLLLVWVSIGLTGIAIVAADMLAGLFAGYDAGLFEMTKYAFIIHSLSFLFCGFNIFGSSLFTALNNGLVSAAISFFRTLVCQTAAVLILPEFFGVNGIWSAIVVAELLSLLLTLICFAKLKGRYHYA